MQFTIILTTHKFTKLNTNESRMQHHNQDSTPQQDTQTGLCVLYRLIVGSSLQVFDQQKYHGKQNHNPDNT